MINFIKSSQIFEDSDNESNDSEEQFEAEESELISLRLCSLLDSHYLEPRIVDHNGIFIDYEIGWPGSVHDAKVYQNSYFYQNYRTLIKGWDYLLGDSAYPLSSFLIKPFNNPVTDLQTHFNVTHSLHHIVIENAFGKLKNSFSCLKGLSVKKISTVVNLTECCIILHNFLETNNDSWNELDENDSDSDDSESDDDDENNLSNLNESNLKREGEIKRDQIMNQLI
ncbi:hypothetical protein RclHR1_07790009 [Rhizophagus clarus]|uniref:DDE Tnp4 domain-containing protein n=1 Tax=Rhizophagus clarus TaxID=94130 RepID=A0A2Z6SLR7_9GLOM|nr:hypothetical protein RclHR1_07790009 [Rhizophagus clarus]